MNSASLLAEAGHSLSDLLGVSRLRVAFDLC
jgi:Co/Zn/Cd efflux system component